jgi:23S rRNA (guanine745-N1)-methyltransferase
LAKRTLFKCPVCNNPLLKGEKQYFCERGHSFDIARRGYVNLLLPAHIGAGTPGDSKEMLRSRREFLNAGHYKLFSDQLNDVMDRLLTERASESTAVLDAGCGEGYYTWRLRNMLVSANLPLPPEIYGTDVSKIAIDYAARRDRNIHFAVASTYHLPILSGTIDCVMCVFAPKDEMEFWRVLKPAGKLVVAAPGPRHLMGLRSMLYNNPEPIGPRGTTGEGFTLLDSVQVSYEIALQGSREIMNLLTMTPYVRHADEGALARLNQLERLENEVDINIMVYQKV